MTKNEGIEDIADILEGQRPVGTVERVGLTPAADIQPRSAGNHQQAHHQAQGKLPALHLQGFRESRSGEEKKRGPDQRSDDHHRMQARQTALEKAPGGHFVPAVVVSITDDETAQHKEEIHGQVPVIDDLGSRTFAVCLKEMKQDDHQGRHATKPVQDLITGFGCQINVFFCHCPVDGIDCFPQR